MRKDTKFISIMINKTSFLESEIAYNDFEKMGIHKKDILNMPRQMLDKIMKGEISQVMQLQPKASNGQTVPILAKVQMVRNAEGNAELRIYPVAPSIRNSLNLKEQELASLKEGKTLLKEQREDGKRKLIYVELDPETNHLITADAKRLKIAGKSNNINSELKLNGISSVKDIELGANQKQQIREGKPVELDVGHQKVTVGVSLKEANGFKIVKGDLDEWKRVKEIKWDMVNPGKIGFWKTDQNRWEYKENIARFFSPAPERTRDIKPEINVSHGMRR